MRKLFVLVAVVMMGLTAPAASRRPTVHVIRHDDGGRLTQYISKFVVWDNNGDTVRIDGDCLSACTLVLGIVDNDKVCATRRGQFGFHSASTSEQYTAEGTAIMWFFYNADVRRVLGQHGWWFPSYHPELLMISARELVRLCE